ASARSSIARSPVDSRSGILSSDTTRIAWDTANPNPSRITLSGAVSICGLRGCVAGDETVVDEPLRLCPRSYEAEARRASRGRADPGFLAAALRSAGPRFLHRRAGRVAKRTEHAA